jgi:protein FAM50
MASPNPSSTEPSRTSTPNPTNSRFAAQSVLSTGITAEDLLKQSTTGLVHLSDFRKRRVEALEQKEREAQDKTLGKFATVSRDG